MTELSPGSILSHYRILSKISAGVMGVARLKTHSRSKKFKPILIASLIIGILLVPSTWVVGRGSRCARWPIGERNPLKESNDPFPVVFTLSLEESQLDPWSQFENAATPPDVRRG